MSETVAGVYAGLVPLLVALGVEGLKRWVPWFGEDGHPKRKLGAGLGIGAALLVAVVASGLLPWGPAVVLTVAGTLAATGVYEHVQAWIGGAK